MQPLKLTLYLSVTLIEYSKPEEVSRANLIKEEQRIMDYCKMLPINIRRCKEPTEPKEYYIRSQDREKQVKITNVKTPSPKISRPRIKLNLEPPPPLPPPIERVQIKLPEVPKMKIKFSSCTTLYKPAQPTYEDYKKIRSKDTSYRSLQNK